MPKLYDELCSWWPLLSAPSDYAEEAAFFRKTLIDTTYVGPRTVLELGSGGGNNASHLKSYFEMTLVDLSPGMLAVSRDLNPECEHLQGDMRSVRLGRLFDAVFVHDAVDYMTTEADLESAITTAFVHCRPGGVALFVPDHVRETFRSETKHGGHDGESQGMRYIEWAYDPDGSDTTYIVEYVYLLREPDGTVRVEHDPHILGLFRRATWLSLFRKVGFCPVVIADAWDREVFVGVRPFG